MHRLLPAFLRAVLFLAVLGTVAFAVRGEDPAAQRPVLVFFLRHAEKSDEGTDPGLSEAGVQRARQWAHLLEKAGVTHLYASEYRRTQETLGPLSLSIAKAITVISARAAEEQVQSIRRLPPGSVAVVSGHSNTIPALLGQFGCECPRTERVGNEARIPDGEFGRLYLLVLGTGAPSTCVELQN